jgi:hypothetical protein
MHAYVGGRTTKNVQQGTVPVRHFGKGGAVVVIMMIMGVHPSGRLSVPCKL